MKNSTSAASRAAVASALAAALGSFASRAGIQPTPSPIHYSIDWQGPTTTAPDSVTSISIAESDVLTPPAGGPAFGPLANPAMGLTGGQLGLNAYTSCAHEPGQPCRIEVDALSFGTDYRFQPPPPPGGHAAQGIGTPPHEHLFFSVDEHAVSLTVVVGAPDVASEAAAGDASADVFTSFPLPAGPLPPGAVPIPRNAGVLDGDGLTGGSGFRYPGVGLVEPNFPSLPPDTGDDLDALDMGPVPSGPLDVYFSLDGAFIDPVLNQTNSGSAQLQGVPPGAILRKRIGGAPIQIYATPQQLGLDLQGPNTDDLDALIVWENGVFGYQPSTTPFDWFASLTFAGSSTPKDMVVFSVRRGSMVVGLPDSRFGLPIEPGDLLTPPPAAGATPGIWIAAENLGLKTKRAFPGMIAGDELDASSTTQSAYFDCNDNGTEDGIDIANGTSSDDNKNGIPDECERRRPRFLIPKN